MRRLLDKRELMLACAALGIGVADSRFPVSPEDVREIARDLSFPVLLKPRTQVQHRYQGKGTFVASADELLGAYDAYLRNNHFHPWIVARCPDVGQPMVQTYHPIGTTGIYSVAGFAGPDGAITSLASRKVLQRPRRLGIGLCFETAETRPDIEDALSRLCRLVGYAGIFEAEFVQSEGRYLLIDFNPRYYSQMQFEIDRGLPLPLLSYRLAVDGRLDGRLDSRVVQSAGERRGYVHSYLFALLIRGWRLTRQMPPQETEQWIQWQKSFSPGMLSCAAKDPDDRMPDLVDRVAISIAMLKHPRANVRWLLFER
jgi:predicted ATP-grasp superfamily ATP-dependent carboligase